MPITAEPIFPACAALGEGAIWNQRENVLHWVDIDAFKIHTFNPATGEDTSIDVGTYVGTVVCRSPERGGGFVVGLQKEFAHVDAAGNVTSLATLTEHERNRCNDGKCDPSGRFWCGSFNFDLTSQACNLWMLDLDGKLHQKLDKVGVSNGLVWTSDHKTMYYIDTMSGHLDAFDFDNATGNISNRRNAVTNTWGAFFDGMTIDSDGNVYIAMWEGGAVLRIDPKRGKLLDKIEIPGAMNITSCAFGGKDLKTLYITSSGKETDKSQQPNGGHIFQATIPNVQGVPAFEYLG